MVTDLDGLFRCDCDNPYFTFKDLSVPFDRPLHHLATGTVTFLREFGDTVLKVTSEDGVIVSCPAAVDSSTVVICTGALACTSATVMVDLRVN